IKRPELMKITEKLLLEQGYGGFNFSALSKLLGVGRSTLYEYYASKDELIVDYMNELMVNYTDELSVIVASENAKDQLLQLIELMIKYAHVHNVLKVIPLLQSNSDIVINMKENFISEHMYIVKEMSDINENGKRKLIIREDILTEVLVNLLLNTINTANYLVIYTKSWAKCICEIVYEGMWT